MDETPDGCETEEVHKGHEATLANLQTEWNTLLIQIQSVGTQAFMAWVVSNMHFALP
jgi:hypothetical protein